MAFSFPRWSDGNVEIRLKDKGESLVLHGHVLSVHSTWFKASLSEKWNTSGANKDGALTGDPHHWVYELRFEKGSDIGLLCRKDRANSDATEMVAGAANLPPTYSRGEDVGSHLRRMEVVEAHRRMLGSVYHIRPALEHWWASGLFYRRNDPVDLVEFAQIYGCEDVVDVHVENHLLLNRDVVLLECQKESVAMLSFGMKIRSDWVFKEAATHVLGRCERSWLNAQLKLEQLGIKKLFDDKRQVFVTKLKSLEHMLFRISPESRTFYCHVEAVNFFRQWLIDEIEAGKGSGLTPGYAYTYRTIAAGFSDENEDLTAKAANYIDTISGEGQLGALDTMEEYIGEVFQKANAMLGNVLCNATFYFDKYENLDTPLRFMRIEDNEPPWAPKASQQENWRDGEKNGMALRGKNIVESAHLRRGASPLEGYD